MMSAYHKQNYYKQNLFYNYKPIKLNKIYFVIDFCPKF